jgi:Zn finger protein HypA/HybF involved in hydrogenase expression
MTLKLDHPLKIDDVLIEWCGNCHTNTPHLKVDGLADPCTRCTKIEAKAPAPRKPKIEQIEMF